MIILDTDHLSVVRGEFSNRRTRLLTQIASAGDDVIGTTIISIEEQMRGWLACIAKERLTLRQVSPYDELIRLFEFFADYHIVRFDQIAADLSDTFKHIRIATADRKIAATAIVNSALLLTANRRDFERIPGLRFENWMD